MKSFLEKEFNKNKKAISPLIATILLIVVSVAIIAIILTWSRTFADDSLSPSPSILDLTPSHASHYIFGPKTDGSTLFFTYSPPPNLKTQTILITSYSLPGSNTILPLDENISLREGFNSILEIDLSSFDVSGRRTDLVLITSNNEYITLRNVDLFSYKAPISFSCPEGWALVPNDPLFNTGDFCVMKWEAKMDASDDGLGDYPEGDYAHCSNCAGLWKYGCEPDPSCIGTIVSTAEGMPISSVNQLDAISLCESIDAQLLTNDHWMTIARNVSNNPDNWADKDIGSTISSDGGLFRGNVDLDDSVSCGSSTPLDGLTAGTNCIVNNEHHTDRNKRVLILSNGEEIWDLSGNLYQWTNDVIDLTPNGPPKFNDDGNSSTSDNWYDYFPKGGSGRYIDRNNLGTLPLDVKDLFLDGNYNANHGVGRIYLMNSSTDRAFLRGVYWSYGTSAGLLSLSLFTDSSHTLNHIGLRCFK